MSKTLFSLLLGQGVKETAWGWNTGTHAIAADGTNIFVANTGKRLLRFTWIPGIRCSSRCARDSRWITSPARTQWRSPASICRLWMPWRVAILTSLGRSSRRTLTISFSLFLKREQPLHQTAPAGIPELAVK